MTDRTPRADCARCAALCCVALSFDRSDQFAFDKRAGEVCRHLDADNSCTIHASLTEQGMGGCARYDCQGAGQRVTQEVFGGRSWRADPALLRPMLEAFRTMRQIHEQLTLLDAAAGLPLDLHQRARARTLRLRLTPKDGWSAAGLKQFERDGLAEEVSAFLAELRSAARRAGNMALAVETARPRW